MEFPADETRMSWFVSHFLGYTMEYAAMSAVFIALAERSRGESALELQQKSGEKVKIVEQNMKDTSAHQSTVSKAAARINEVTAESMGQAESIQQALEQQKILAAYMEEAFQRVHIISERLRKVSVQE